MIIDHIVIRLKFCKESHLVNLLLCNHIICLSFRRKAVCVVCSLLLWIRVCVIFGDSPLLGK